MIKFTKITIFVLLITFISGCEKDTTPIGDRDFRQDMRDFVQTIATYARQTNPDFIVIPQNGHALLAAGEDTSAGASTEYVATIDGVGREDLFYGYDEDNVATSAEDRDEMLAYMDLAEDNGVEVLATDYTWNILNMDTSYQLNHDRGYISFAADNRELHNIPSYPFTPFRAHTGDVSTLAEAENFLYLINPSLYGSKAQFLADVDTTDYDVIIMDLFFDETTELTSSDITGLKTKAHGGSRLLIAYMSIGESEDYRYYWQSNWKLHDPIWLEAENPNWKGNFKVRYWEKGWQDIIVGNDSSYLKKIMDAGFDGVYLDIIDAYEYFEEL